MILHPRAATLLTFQALINRLITLIPEPLRFRTLNVNICSLAEAETGPVDGDAGLAGHAAVGVEWGVEVGEEEGLVAGGVTGREEGDEGVEVGKEGEGFFVFVVGASGCEEGEEEEEKGGDEFHRRLRG